MKLIKPFLIQCSYCSEIIEVDTDLDLVNSYERAMGQESEYEGLIEDICPHCGADIFVRIYAWEYPIGILNYYKTELDGAELIEEPSISAFES